MTRSETIAIINARLSSLDDEEVQAVAEIIEDMTSDDDLPRVLESDELAAIEQSRADFREGRTYSLAEAKALTDQFLAKLGVQKSKS
jgi:hypothetical protein